MFESLLELENSSGVDPLWIEGEGPSIGVKPLQWSPFLCPLEQRRVIYKRKSFLHCHKWRLSKGRSLQGGRTDPPRDHAAHSFETLKVRDNPSPSQ